MAKATPLPEHATPVDPVLARVHGLATPICDGRGLSIASAQWATDHGGRVLRLTIEPNPALMPPVPPGGVDPSVSLDECAWVSRALSEVLDADEDIVPGAYSLEVSSPGIERELVSWADVRRFVGRSAKVKLSAPLPDGQRAFRGRILAMSDGAEPTVTMEIDGKEQRFGVSAITSAHLVMDLMPAKTSRDEVTPTAKSRAAKPAGRLARPSKDPKRASKKAPIAGSQS